MDCRPVAIEDFTEIKYLSDPRFSPDGKMIVYLVTQVRPDRKGYICDLWLYDTAVGSSRQATADGQVKGYFWDGEERLTFWRKSAEGTDFYRWTGEGTGEQKVFSLPFSVNKICPLGGGQYALTRTTDTQKEPERYHILEEAPYCSNGHGLTAGQRTGLYIYNERTDVLQKLTEDHTDVGDFVCRNGMLVFQATPWEDYRTYLYGHGLYTYQVNTGEVKQIVRVGRINSFSLCFWRDDELLFSGIEDSLGKSMGQNSDFYTVNIYTGAIKRFCDVDMKIGYGGTGSDAKYGGGQGICLGVDGVYFLAPVMDGTCINRMDFQGKVEKNVTEEDGFAGSVESFDLFEGHLVCGKMVSNGVVELYLDGRQITDFNERYLKSHELSVPELVRFTSRDGVELHGFCMKPVGYMPGKRYPGILHIHGGPKTIFGDVFHHEMQLWSNNGFFVFYCNPRGSDGRGRDFADIRGRWGTVDYTDLMMFTDVILERFPDIDPARIGVCGGSYGGFMTNWIIGHTNRFAAACSQRSFANMINFEYLSDIGLSNIRSEHLCSAEENFSAMWEESPLKYAPNCNTPTLFIHSDQDFRCPLPDALSMFSCLKRAGCPARLCLFHGENHELSRSGRPDNRITRLEEILNWFKRYLQ